MLSKIEHYTTNISYEVDSVIEVSWVSESLDYIHHVILDVGEHRWIRECASGINKCTITINEEKSNQILNSISTPAGNITLHLRTYNKNGVQIGSLDTKSITVFIPENRDTIPTIDLFSIKPYIDPNISDIFGSVFIKGYSRPVFEISANPGVNAETCYCYVDEVDNKLSKVSWNTMDGNSFTGEVINSSGSFSYSCVVDNTRGYTSAKSKSVSIDVLDYYYPIIDSFTVDRNISDSKSVDFSFSYDCCGINGNNKVVAKIEYKSQSDTEWKIRNITELPYSGKRSGSITLSEGEFDTEKNYNFRLTITDLLGESDTTDVVVPKLSVLMHFPAEQKGIGFGKHVDDDKYEVGFDARFYKEVKMDKNLEIDGLIKGENFGRYIYVGKENCLDKDENGMFKTGALTDDFNIRIYLVKPFNFIYFRMFINGLKENFPQSVSMKELCTIRPEFKPAYWTPFAVSGGRNCDVLIKTDGTLNLTAWTEVPTNATIYISGFYPLSSSSPLFVQNASKTIDL